MIDPYRTSVVFLMNCDSLLEEVSASNASAFGQAAVDTTQKVFGTGSIKLDGNGDYITVPDSTKWDFGTGEFTIELRVRFTSSPSNAPTFITQWGNGWFFGFKSATDIYFRAYDTATFGLADSNSYAWTPTLNQWYALAVDRDASNVLRIYIDGTMVSKTTSYGGNFTGSGGPLTIGSLEAASPFSFSGYDLAGFVDEVRVTKGKGRYASDGGYTPATEAFSILPYEAGALSDGIGVGLLSAPAAKYGLTSTSGIGVGSLTYAGAQFIVSVSDGIATALTQGVLRALALTDGVGVALAQSMGQTVGTTDRLRSQDFIAPTKRLSASASAGVGVAETLKRDIGFVLRERIGVAELLAPAFKYQSWASDLVRAAAALRVGMPVALSNGIGMADLSLAVVGAYVLERLGLRDAMLPTAKYGQTVTDRVRINDALRRFIGGAFADTLGMSDSLVPRFMIGRTLSETIGVHDALTPKLLVRLTVADGVKITPTQALKMVFKPVLTDAVEISAAHVSPNGTITTWVVNTRTGAVTEYGNYEFNSFAQRGHHYLGASSTGLYQLDGDDDQGADIVARIKSGWAQFAGSRYSMFKAAYLGVHGSGDVFFKLEAGTGETYTYQVKLQDSQTTKVRMGKGLRARYFSFELVTTGQDFDLDTIEFVPIVAQRRV